MTDSPDIDALIRGPGFNPSGSVLARQLIRQMREGLVFQRERITDLTAERDRMKKALDEIYNHNAATRAAVIMYYGLWHLSDD